MAVRAELPIIPEPTVAPPTDLEHAQAHVVRAKQNRKHGDRFDNLIARFNLDQPVGTPGDPQYVPHPNHGFRPSIIRDGKAYNIAGEELPKLPNIEPSAKVVANLRHPKRITVPQGDPADIEVTSWENVPKDAKRKDGQRLQVYTANREHFGPHETVISFSGNYANRHGENEAEERMIMLGDRLRGYGLIGINPPNLGKSDGLTKEQKADLVMQVADAELRIMKKLGVTSAIFVGQSDGAHIELAKALLAHKYGIEVKQLILEEIPLIDDVRELFKRTNEERPNLDISHVAGNTRMVRAAEQLKPRWKLKVRDTIFPLKVVGKYDPPPFRYGRSAADDTAEERLRQLLMTPGSDNIKITFINGDSKVSPKEKVYDIVKNLRNLAGGRYKDNISSKLIPGVGHFALVVAELNAAMVNHSVHGQSLPQREDLTKAA